MNTVEEKQACTFAMLCHLLSLTTFIGIPFGNIIAPLIMWLVKKNDFPFVDEQGKESLNFLISMTIYGIIAGILCFIIIGIPLLGLLVVLDIIFVIIASVKSSNGESYRYPMTLRLIK